MAMYEWDNSIALGIPLIDEQHKALFDWISALDTATKNGDGSEEVGKVVWKLISYITEHFSEEERLMLSCNYPELESHRKEHDLFVARLQGIQAAYGDGHEMSKSILDFMAEWLVTHIKGTDQSYSRFIHEQG